MGICSWRLCLSLVSSSFSVLWQHISASISTSLSPLHHSILRYHRLIVKEQGSLGMSLGNGSQSKFLPPQLFFYGEIMSTIFPAYIFKNSRPLPPNWRPSYHFGPNHQVFLLGKIKMMGWGYSSLVEYLACVCAWSPAQYYKNKKDKIKMILTSSPYYLVLIIT